MTIDLAAIEARARDAMGPGGSGGYWPKLAADCLATIARLRLADELVAAVSAYMEGDGDNADSRQVMECLRRWHEGDVE